MGCVPHSARLAPSACRIRWFPRGNNLTGNLEARLEQQLMHISGCSMHTYAELPRSLVAETRRGDRLLTRRRHLPPRSAAQMPRLEAIAPASTSPSTATAHQAGDVA